MEVTHTLRTDPQEHKQRVRRTFEGARVIECGMAELEPGAVAHADEEHRHEHDEVFFVLAGEVVLPTGDGGLNARVGDWLRVDAGAEHHLTNRSNLPARVIYMLVARGEAE